MENTKMNDMLLSTLSNPEAKTLDFINNGVTPENTQLLKKDDYKNNDLIKTQFTDNSGVFQDEIFNQAYGVALDNFNKIANENAANNLDTVEYEAFDWTRPMASKVRAVDIKYTKDINPYETLYNRESFGSITESALSLREIAQKGRIYDTVNDKWKETSANNLGIFDKFFGDTLVYAQWDEEGIHEDLATGRMVNHMAGDWKSDSYGKLYVETLGNRELYGKQVLNPSDILTTDGSIFNKFDFLDSDGREKSIPSIAAKTIMEIAPLLIPGFNTYYGGAKAALGLATVMPTFLKALQGFLAGDSLQFGDDPITKAENWMAKYRQPSTSDAGSEGMWNIEQMSSMVTGIFSQIYEQRAMASLSKYMVKPGKLLDTRTAQLQAKLSNKAMETAIRTGVDTSKALQNAVQHLPELQAAFAKQSNLSKGLSLGYMALSSTSEVYGEALAGGFDRRSAGFAAMLAAGGQYGLMMNNRMGDWFLDKTTGYTTETNKALISKSIKPWLGEIDKVFTDSGLTKEGQKLALANIMTKVSAGARHFFTAPSVLGEAMLKNAAIEGVEEVTEEIVEDMSKGILDLMSYFGLTKKKGSFQTLERFQTGEFFDDYLANFVGGVLGGGLFELEASKISPWVRKHVQGKPIPKQTLYNIYDLVANGHKDDLIRSIRIQSPKLANRYLSYTQDIDIKGDTKSDSNFLPKDGASQADLVSKAAIEMVEHLEGILGSEGLLLNDDQIINKAIGNELKINALNKMKEAGAHEHIGIEGLLLQDYKKAASEAANLKSNIMDYESAPEKVQNESNITVEKDKLKEKMAIVKDILEGKRNMKYFNMMTVSMNPDIQKIFGALDRNSYVQAKYKVDYESLQETGLEGLNKQSMDEEWGEFVQSTDLLHKLEAITNGYVDLETTLNDPIFKTVDSDYYNVRKRTQEEFLDLDVMIKSFNVSKNSTERAAALERFRDYNKELESKDGIKILPWDSFKIDLGDRIFNEGLVKKEFIDDAGVIQYADYTDAELDKVLGNGKTLKESLKANINNVLSSLPSNPLDTDLLIKQYNSTIEFNNAELHKKIVAVENSDASPEDKLIEIQFYQDSMSNSRLANISQSNSSRIFDRDNLAKHEAKVNSIKKGNEESINDYQKAKQVEYKYTKDGEIVSFNAMVDANGGTNGDWNTLSTVGKINVLNEVIELEIVSEVIQSMNNVKGDEDSTYEKNAYEYLDTLNDSESKKTIDTSFEQGFFDRIKNNIERVTGLLKNTEISDKLNRVVKEENDYKARKQKAMPDIFQMPNYAFDFLVNALKSGHYDNELYLEAKTMYEQELSAITKQIFPQADYISIDRMNAMIDYDMNPEESGETLSFILSSNAENELDLDMTDTVETFLKDLAADEYVEKTKGLELLTGILENNLDPNTLLIDVASQLEKFSEDVQTHKESLQRLKSFTELDASKMVTNPMYDMLRNFNMTMDSNPRSKVNTVFDINAREEISYKASAGVDNYTASGVNIMDMQQSVNVIDMFKTVVNSMSTTERFGDDMNGFLAMRQDFAKRMDIKDPVSDLKTINSDQAAVMSRDLDRLKVKLEFLMELSKDNQRNIAAEPKKTGAQANIVHIELFKDLDLIDGLTPSNFKDIINSSMSPLEQITKLETAFYDHHKGDKVGAMEKILGVLNNVSTSNMTTYNTETTSKNMSPYTKATYFATVLSTRGEDYLKMQKNSLLGEYNKAPFFVQELGIRTGIATTVNPDVFTKIFELKQDKTKDTADFITFVLGGTGTGKTSVIGAQFLDIMRQFNKNSNVWVGGPTIKQATTLHSDIISAVGEVDLNLTKVDIKSIFKLSGDGISEVHAQMEKELKDVENKSNSIVVLDKITGKIKINIDPEWAAMINFDNLPNLLIFDEVTHLSKPEILLLNFISDASYKNTSGNFFKVIGTGDTSQMGKQIKVGKQFVEYNLAGLNSIFTPYLTTSVRNSNDHKKINYGILSQHTAKAIELYNAETVKGKDLFDYKRADKALEAYLANVNSSSGLSYHMKGSTFRGEYIANSYSDIEALKTINKDIETNKAANKAIPTFSILTESGEISPELYKSLKDAGFSDDYIDNNLEIHSLANVQGSEADYFLFDFNLVPEYDKKRDLLKAFYTYAMRSKVGTVVYDTGQVIKTELKITNAKMSQSTVDFNVLTETVIQELKNERIAEISEVVDSEEVSEESKYIWKTGKTVESTKPTEGGDATKNSGQPTSFNLSGIVLPNNSDPIQVTSEKVLKKVPYEDFKAMGHTFLNVPNAKIDMVRGKPSKLTVHSNPIKMDLNGNSNIEGEDLQVVLDQWVSLKNDLVRSNSTSIKVNKYPKFFQHIFGNRSSNIQVKYVSLAHLHQKDLHAPILTHADGIEGALTQNDLVRTISAELTSGTGDNAKTHFITLALFPRVNTLKTSGLNHLDASAEVKNKLISDYIGINTVLRKSLLEGDSNEILKVIEDVDASDLEIITSTRLERGGKVKHSLADLKSKFPGMKMSEIKILPNNKEDFDKVVNQYSFGTRRTSEELDVLRTGQKIAGDPSSKIHEPFSGKPYIVVSYSGNTEGSIGLDSSARLVPITADSRGIAQLRREIISINKELSDMYKDPNRKGIDKSINAKQESLFDRNQILDILVEWGTTKRDGEYMLDMLTKKVETGLGKLSMVDVMARFKNKADGSQTPVSKSFSEVIEIVKKYTGDKYEPQTVGDKGINSKNNIIRDITGILGWSKDFKNIFTSEFIINSQLKFNEDSKKLSKDDFKNLSILAKHFEDSLKNKQFYYSIPVEPGLGGHVQTNSLISGKGGFKSEYFADRFFINVNPQSEKILFPLNLLTLQADTKGSKVTVRGTGAGTGTGTGTNTTYNFESHFSKQFSELSEVLIASSEYNPDIKTRLQEGLDIVASEALQSNTKLEDLNQGEVFIDVLKKSGIVTESTNLTGYDLAMFMVGEFNNYPDTDRANDLIEKINDAAEKLYEQVMKACPESPFN